MQTVAIPDLKQLPPIPEPGSVYLSVNLAHVSPGLVWGLARQLGLCPELAYMQTLRGVEIHALLHHEQRQPDSLLGDDFDPLTDALVDGGIDSTAIRFVYGGKRAVA
ncbi:MAG: hypothetical protein HC769_33600 [Cyanobacteria bacterium CRU_2_1]|nr:hypothetical protein [Cyanobacteria bacterium RU_5_0]NJR63281.1 hypothetical protein [Cyanobacteria bacterium CRU_2_1]